MRRRITCPESGHLEEIEYYEGPATGRVLGVVRCSAFSPADEVDCAQECVAQLKRGLARTRIRHTTGEYPTQSGPVDQDSEKERGST